jgi:hypothetical protein
VRPETRRALKIAAAENETTITEMMQMAID